jgi:hypothetical protein
MGGDHGSRNWSQERGHIQVSRVDNMLKRLTDTMRTKVALVARHGNNHGSEDGIMRVAGVQLIFAKETITGGKSAELRSRQVGQTSWADGRAVK